MSVDCSPGQAEFAAALLDPSLPAPPELRSWNGSDISARLAVYRNNVVSSLVDALAETHLVVRELVGDEFFRAMAAVFVRQHPPRSRILVHYGDEFAEFLEQFEPAAALPYLADVARLERARVFAYHCIDAPVAGAEQITRALSSGDRIGQIRFDWHPSLAVLESRFAIVSLFAAHQGLLSISAVDPGIAETAVVVRDGFEVVVLHAPPGTAAFVAASRRGAVLTDAAEQARHSDAAFDLSVVLATLNNHGAIQSIHLPME